jgi:hypothetical protein
MDDEDNAAGVHPGVADSEHTSLAGHQLCGVGRARCRN